MQSVKGLSHAHILAKPKNVPMDAPTEVQVASEKVSTTKFVDGLRRLVQLLADRLRLV